MDKDGSTDISIKELVNFKFPNCDLGDVEDEAITEEIHSNQPDPEAVFNHIDTNGDGVLSYDELNQRD